MDSFNPHFLFITALPLETRAVKAVSGFRPIGELPLPCFLSDDGFLGIAQTGVGPKNMPLLENLLESLSTGMLINIGIAGWLPDDDFSPGHIFNVKEVSLSGKNYPPITLPDTIGLPYPTANLLTVEEPVLNTTLKKQLHSEYSCQLVDMEAYWVCRAAQTAGKNITVVKVVSDEAGENTMSQISQNLPLLKNKLQLAVHQIKRQLF